MLFIAIPYGNAQHSKTSRSFSLRIFETQARLEPSAGPITTMTCVVVFPDGLAHLELRRQEMFRLPTSLTSYEYSLNNMEISRLRGMLNTESVTTLPEWVQPSIPMSVHEWHGVSAEISRDTKVQEIGYFEWEGDGPNNAGQAQETWSRSKTAMQPLIEWFHAFKSDFQWKHVSNPKEGVCGRL